MKELVKINLKNKYKNIAEEILGYAGIKINGSNSWDITVHNDEFYKRVLTQGELGLGESYMDGWWDAKEIDSFIYKVLTAKLDEKIKRSIFILARFALAKIINMQSVKRAFIIGERHYDLGNDLFRNLLDKRMNYSCAYWKNAKTLDEAQENKLELICKKLYLEPGMRVLDIGCGWGAFGKYAAEKYGVEVVGVTVSKEQVELGRKMCEGLPVEFRLTDYRNINEKYDRIVSIGMIEHVGYKNYKTYFKVAEKCLKEDGLFLLHTIGNLKSVNAGDPWTDKYIFPNGMLPSVAQLSKAMEKLFVIEDLHNFGADYDKTLMAWYKNFIDNWDRIKDKYGERFFRMWKYFLLSSAGSFRARKNQLWQFVLSKTGVPGGYTAVR
ncbi:cyclopropane fatty acyl phospholipid synthase [Melioribacter sp. OK-6-Me]|uniref:cyclopropane fatty acyl phospholipid synthase n=1 Tax=unclassified Melioribacter TaxID=2627329 RepID=UPI003ED9F768